MPNNPSITSAGRKASSVPSFAKSAAGSGYVQDLDLAVGQVFAGATGISPLLPLPASSSIKSPGWVNQQGTARDTSRPRGE